MSLFCFRISFQNNNKILGLCDSNIKDKCWVFEEYIKVQEIYSGLYKIYNSLRLNGVRYTFFFKGMESFINSS